MMENCTMTSLPKFINHRIEEFALQVTYNPEERTGTLVYNLSLIRSEDLEFAIKIFKDSYRAGISVSGLVRFLQPGVMIEDYQVPEGCTGMVSVCSSTLDGLLLRRGIPMNPIGGGVVEIDHRIPKRFIHMILYEHTTIDPLQVLISQELTSVNSVMRRGSGNLLANIRECHMEAEPLVGEVLDSLTGSDLSGILEVGMPNTPALGVTVDPQYLGIVAVGGTNPMAAIREEGRWEVIRAMKGLMDAGEMTHINEY
jgi:global nitrogen regulator NrpRII